MRTVEEAESTKDVAELYDRSSSVTEDILGDHLHTGIHFVDSSSHQEEKAFKSLPRPDQIRIIRAAQVRTIEEALRFAAVPGFSLSLHSSPPSYMLLGGRKYVHLSSLCIWQSKEIVATRVRTLAGSLRNLPL